MRKSKFIVIEGIDGVGKGTQAHRAYERFGKEGYGAELIAFPRYGELACADVEAYLRGEFGDPDSVDPRTASRFYADDRLDATPMMRKLLTAGTNIVCDRYVDSNAGHQGGKIRDLKEREAYLEWLYALEYEEHKIPKPDLVIILYAHFEAGQALLERRTQDVISPEGATGGHEKNQGHLRRASDAFLWLARREPELYRAINCSPRGTMLSIEQIHEMIWGHIAQLLATLEGE